LALYLVLVVVGDHQGVSYYSDRSLARLLGLDQEIFVASRQRLIDEGLIAYQRPLYQVLSLDREIAPPRGASSPIALSEILKRLGTER